MEFTYKTHPKGLLPHKVNSNSLPEAQGQPTCPRPALRPQPHSLPLSLFLLGCSRQGSAPYPGLSSGHLCRGLPDGSYHASQSFLLIQLICTYLGVPWGRAQSGSDPGLSVAEQAGGHLPTRMCSLEAHRAPTQRQQTTTAVGRGTHRQGPGTAGTPYWPCSVLSFLARADGQRQPSQPEPFW